MVIPWYVTLSGCSNYFLYWDIGLFRSIQPSTDTQTLPNFTVNKKVTLKHNCSTSLYIASANGSRSLNFWFETCNYHLSLYSYWNYHLHIFIFGIWDRSLLHAMIFDGTEIEMWKPSCLTVHAFMWQTYQLAKIILICNQIPNIQFYK